MHTHPKMDLRTESYAEAMSVADGKVLVIANAADHVGLQPAALLGSTPSSSLLAVAHSPTASTSTLCMACSDTGCDFKPMQMHRRPLLPNDVLIKMKFCGVCHSDLHSAAGHLGKSEKKYPMVPGHDLVGIVAAVGLSVTKFKVGEAAGVGCMVDSCGTCKSCKRGEEQKCFKMVPTYGGKDKGSGRAETFPPGQTTLGGYTEKMVVNENFAIKIPDGYDLKYAGPVMCAGVTMYDPLKRQGAGPGTRVGIAGLGGLGQMGVKIAKAMGCVVTVISHSGSKKAFATECGADHFITSSRPSDMEGARKSLDLILNTIPVMHDYTSYTKLLKSKGRQVILGLHAGIAASFIVDYATFHHSKLIGSGIGGIEATQDVIDLCHKHDIKPAVEVVPVTDLNKVYTLLGKTNKTGLRYVLDIEGSLTRELYEGQAALVTAQPPEVGPNESNFTCCGICSECCYVCCLCKWC